MLQPIGQLISASDFYSDLSGVLADYYGDLSRQQWTGLIQS